MCGQRNVGKFRDAVKIEHKTSTFFNRIDRIASKVTQLDSTIEEVSLQDLHLRKPFKSSSLIDQQSLSRQTMPAAMAECYMCCDKPPELDKLNPYRVDGKQALKFYTDPDYFFELWRQEMLKDADFIKKSKHANKAKAGHGADRKNKSREKQKVNRENIHPHMLSNTDVSHSQVLKNVSLIHNHTLQQQEKLATNQIYASDQYGSTYRPVSADTGTELSDVRSIHHVGGTATCQVINCSNTSSTGYGSLASCDDLVPIAGNQQSNNLNYRPINILRRGNRAYQAYDNFSNSAAATVDDADSCTLIENGQGVTFTSSANENNQLSSSADQSRSVCLGATNSRPVRPPPAPPINAANTPVSHLNGPMADLHLVDQYASVNKSSCANNDAAEVPHSNHAHSLSPPPPPPPLTYNQSPISPIFSSTKNQSADPSLNCHNGHSIDRSDSPDLPPPPPPLYMADADESSQNQNGLPVVGVAQATSSVVPPPPPPPPPPHLKSLTPPTSNGDWSASKTLSSSMISRQTEGTGCSAVNHNYDVKGGTSAPPPLNDGRSDLLRAIREGIQLKKVGRMEERQREKALVEGHDVAAILKKRMEDVRGRESEESDDENDNIDDISASGFDDDWDD